MKINFESCRNSFLTDKLSKLKFAIKNRCKTKKVYVKPELHPILPASSMAAIITRKPLEVEFFKTQEEANEAKKQAVEKGVRLIALTAPTEDEIRELYRNACREIKATEQTKKNGAHLTREEMSKVYGKALKKSEEETKQTKKNEVHLDINKLGKPITICGTPMYFELFKTQEEASEAKKQAEQDGIFLIAGTEDEIRELYRKVCREEKAIEQSKKNGVH